MIFFLDLLLDLEGVIEDGGGNIGESIEDSLLLLLVEDEFGFGEGDFLRRFLFATFVAVALGIAGPFPLAFDPVAIGNV